MYFQRRGFGCALPAFPGKYESLYFIFFGSTYVVQISDVIIVC